MIITKAQTCLEHDTDSIDIDYKQPFYKKDDATELSCFVFLIYSGLTQPLRSFLSTAAFPAAAELC